MVQIKNARLERWRGIGPFFSNRCKGKVLPFARPSLFAALEAEGVIAEVAVIVC